MNEMLDNVAAEIRAAWRYRWHALVVAWVVIIVGWALVSMIPNKYESKTQIYVDTSSILRPLLQGIAVSTNVESEADVVRRALLSRPTLDKVASKTGLVSEADTPQFKEAMIATLEKNITIAGDSKLNIYTITYDDSSAQKAQAVVQSLLDYFVGDSLGANRTDTVNAQRFLREQVADYEARLSDAEKRLAEFKKQNFNLMPDQRGDYFQRLQAEMTGLQKAQNDLAVAVQEREELRRKVSADTVPGAPAVKPPTDTQISAATEVDRRLQDSRKQLDELLLKFTDKHPDVIAMRETIARLQERREAELGSVRATSGTTNRDGSTGVDEVLQSLQIKLDNADVAVAVQKAQVEQAEGRVGELKRVIESEPEIEAQLARLSRDYGVTKTQYEQLLSRLETAKISDQADQSQEMKFKVLEPPRVPLAPVAPMRVALICLVGLAAVAAGAATAYLFSQAQPVFVTVHSLEKSTGAAVYGVVSRFVNPDELARAARMNAVYGLCWALLLVTLGAGIALRQEGVRLLHSALSGGPL